MYATNCSPKWCKLSQTGVLLSGNLRSTFTFLTILEGNFKPSHFCSISFRRVIYILASYTVFVNSANSVYIILPNPIAQNYFRLECIFPSEKQQRYFKALRRKRKVGQQTSALIETNSLGQVVPQSG